MRPNNHNNNDNVCGVVNVDKKSATIEGPRDALSDEILTTAPQLLKII